MTNPHFFGYGSLVNRATHPYPNAASATAHGWRRAWVHTNGRPHAFLTAVPAPGHKIQGLIAEVPDADWVALDERESAYERRTDTANIMHEKSGVADIAIYAVAPENFSGNSTKHTILLSYLDVVIQGYLAEFGAGGVHKFFASTDGWDAPILNDRHDPIYPRHQSLTDQETAFVDAKLAELKAKILEP
jgi:hypothetical protein